MKQVTAITKNDNSTLVEFVDNGKTKRVIVPRESVQNGRCDEEVLKMGILHGIPWAEMEIKVDGAILEAELHRAGIWTLDDLRSRAGHINAALARATQTTLNNFIKFAESYKEN